MLISLLFILILLSGFLSKELLKKFRFWKDFQIDYPHQITYTYDGDKKPGMYIIKIKGNKDFFGLIGFDFSLGPINNGGLDIFGYVESKSNNECHISLYLGKGPVKFIFLMNLDAEISIRISEDVDINPDYIFLPHWWQKIDFFSRYTAL